MAGIGTYGFLNAKVRAMRSALLTEAFLRGLSATRGFQEFLNQLYTTPYRYLSERGRTATPGQLEAAIFQDEVARIRRLERFSEGDVGRFISLFLDRYEAERLKVILRYRRAKKSAAPWMRERIAYALPVDALLSSEGFEEVLRLLEGTPFRDDLSALPPSAENDFAVETAIDRGVFGRLHRAVSALGRRDADIAGRILGLEVDLKNLEAIGRYRRYYEIPAARMVDFLLPNGYRLNPERLTAIAAGGSLPETLADVLRTIRIGKGDNAEGGDDLALIERFLFHALLAEAKRAFAQFPFTVGSVIGYLMLLRIESRNIRTLIQSKMFELTPDETEALLVF